MLCEVFRRVGPALRACGSLRSLAPASRPLRPLRGRKPIEKVLEGYFSAICEKRRRPRTFPREPIFRLLLYYPRHFAEDFFSACRVLSIFGPFLGLYLDSAHYLVALSRISATAPFRSSAHRKPPENHQKISRRRTSP